MTDTQTAPDTRFARYCRHLPRGDALPRLYCRVRPCVWFLLPDADPDDRATYECMRCEGRRHNPPKEGERPLAYNEQKRAIDRTRQNSNYPDPEQLP